MVICFIILNKKMWGPTKNKHPRETVVICFCTYTLGTHSLTVLSRDPDAIKFPDGENETEVIAS